ncbi:LCP family protein [Streptomyces sp. NPDC058773]|uniref:LCP family protein n=1 Tax=Streptomyces sp. NPDC058773 TaxID=3346632 RepID=UPI00368256B6
MTEWLEGPHDGNWRGGETQAEYVGTGEFWYPADPAQQVYTPEVHTPLAYGSQAYGSQVQGTQVYAPQEFPSQENPFQAYAPQEHPPRMQMPQEQPAQAYASPVQWPQEHPAQVHTPPVEWPQMHPPQVLTPQVHQAPPLDLEAQGAELPAPVPPPRLHTQPGRGRPPVRTGRKGPGDGNGDGDDGRGRRTTRPPRKRRRTVRVLIVLSTVLAVGSAGTYVWADTELHREVDLDKIADRPPEGGGTNYLIVGSDSRVGLSDRARKNLHTGGSADAGRRTDSMIILHTGEHGASMVSLPRDSWVTIPSHIRPETGKHYRASKNKLNAAFSFGGPDLLVRTIEHNTGVHIDHYTEIGFAGFVGIVNAVGGVPMCLDRDIKDKKSGANLKKGCHTLDGRTALAFVRQRHQEAKGDLGRSQNQQKFLAALAHKAATPGVLLDPGTVYPTMSAGLGTLIVDKDTGLPNLTSLFKAMKGVTEGDGKRLNVPVASLGFPTSKGSAVLWNKRKAQELFSELSSDRPVTVGDKN